MTQNNEYASELRILGDRIRTLREKQGLSQEALGDKADLHRNYISRLELAQRNPTYTTLLKIANALSISIVDLIKDTQ